MFPYRRLPSHINGLYIFTITNFMVLCHITLVQGAISVISLKTNQTVLFDIRDMPARFGRDVERDIRGQIVYAEPANACVPIQSPPNSTGVSDLQWFVLIMRYGCNFSKKVLNAQVAGFHLAVVHNVGSDQLEPMGPDDDQEDVEIPSVFIGESDGLLIKNTYTYDKEYILQISPDFPFNLNTYLIPFAVGVGVCLVVMCLVLVFKCIRDRHHRQSHRLPSSLLKKLPIKKFKKEDHYDICAICLEDYVEGEKLRVLPCAHTYHLKCIDPWLTQRHRTCPVCKQKVFPGRNNRANDLPDPPSSDVFSDQEDDTNDSLVPNENTPLLNGTNINSLGDVFPTPRSHGSPFFQSGCDTSTDPGWPSYRGSSQLASVNSSPSSSMEDGSLTVPVLIPGGDLLSSGEHSLNGDVMDFSPSENWLPENNAQQQRIPVEGEVLLPPPPRRTPSAGSMLTSSMPSTSTSAQNQSPRQQSCSPPRAYSPRFLRNSRSKRKHSSSGDPDVVV